MVRMNCAMHSNDQLSMAHMKYDEDSSASPQTRKREIQQKIVNLIEDCIVGDVSSVGVVIAQICPQKKVELEAMAQVIVSKALDEPQHCKACVSLAGALRTLLPPLPSTKPGKKGENFMHALLDVFQIEFEAVFMTPSEYNLGLANQSQGSMASKDAGNGASEEHNNRIRALVHFAWHLHCQALVGKGVVQQMVQDLADNGHSDSAKELLWCIDVLKNDKQRNLGTVLEDDCDDASCESV